jgi:hypothetical protein
MTHGLDEPSKRLNVDYKVSLREGKNAAHWNINKDNGTVTHNLPNLWNEAVETKDEERGYNIQELDGDWEHLPAVEGYIDEFIELLVETDLKERVCLERAHEKIRMNGRTRCDPNCCVHRVTSLMLYNDPEKWGAIRKMNPINKQPVKLYRGNGGHVYKPRARINK